MWLKSDGRVDILFSVLIGAPRHSYLSKITTRMTIKDPLLIKSRVISKDHKGFAEATASKLTRQHLFHNVVDLKI